MSEPCLPARHVIPTLPDNELTTLLKHQFPGAVVDTADDKYVVLTVHGVGASPREAIENSLTEYADMKRDGQSLRQMLDDVSADLATTPGMGRERHDSLIELLDLAETALNAGLITKTVPWIESSRYTREITELRRRVDIRLGMTAQEMADREKAKKRAAQKFPRPVQPDSNGQTAYEQLFTRP